MLAEIETADPKSASPPRVIPVPRPSSVSAGDRGSRTELAALAYLAGNEVRPHLLRYSLVALAVGFVAGRILR